MNFWRFAFVLGWIVCAVSPVWAADAPVEIRFGVHEHFGRLVFDKAGGGALSAEHHDDSIVVRLGATARFSPDALPRNVRAVRQQEGTVIVDVLPGALIRRMVVNDHLVIDVVDPPRVPAAATASPPPPRRKAEAKRELKLDPKVAAPTSPAAPALPSTAPPPAAPPPAAPPPTTTVAVPAAGVVPEPQASALPAAMPPPSPAQPQATPPVPAPVVDALAASAHPAVEARPGHVLSLPFSLQTGAAAFRRGGEAIIVFDERKPVDLHRLQDDAVFGAAQVQLLPQATMLRVPLPGPAELRLQREAGAWVITAIGGDAAPPALKPIVPVSASGFVQLDAAQPGLVVSVPDPLGGGILIIGTQREPGQGVVLGRRAPDFSLLASWQGVVIEPMSDVVVLRPVASGFRLGAEGDGAELVTGEPLAEVAAAAEASQMSRNFDLPQQPIASLIRRMQGAVVAAASTPPQSRAAPRLAAAEAMIALGLGVEARAVLSQAVLADARTQDDPAVASMQAVASVLAGHPEDATGLEDARLAGSDEINFWRGVRTAMTHEGSPEAAQIFANTAPLLLAYPSELQRRLLPLVVETLIQGGQTEAAAKLLDQRRAEPGLDLARAMAQRARGGDPAEALAGFDTLSQSPDRLLRARATRAATELRLATGQITAADAAATLGRMLYSWRGDERELELRMRVAELLAQSEQWRPALQLLRETEAAWRDQRAPVHARLQATLAQALQPTAQARLKPFDMVALAEENADLMPDGEAGQGLAQRVSDQLLALDLPDRASAFLEKMVASAPAGLARSTFGAKLAGLRLQQGNPAGALDALTATINSSLPAPLLEERTLIFAKAVAGQGDYASARSALLQLDTAQGDATTADLAESAGQWPDAVTALRRMVDGGVPPGTAPLGDAPAQLVLRLATAASQAGDQRQLAQIRAEQQARIKPGKTADLLNLLTTQPVRGVADLPRASRELALARAAPGALPPLASK